MKRYLGALLCLAMVLILGALPGAAESFTSGDYEYKLDDSGNAELTRYVGEENELITVPASLDGHPVTAIGDGVFKGRASRGGKEWPVTVRLPVGLTHIGDEAFSNCRSLENITLQETLEHIGERAFAECNGLTKLSLPDGLTSLGTRAFYFCENLADVTLSAGLTSIGEEAFSGCSSLVSLTIPEGVTTLGDGMFIGSKLTNVVLPTMLTRIGDEAFSKCSGLENITLPETLEHIGEGAFSYCIGLTKLSLPTSLKSIGSYAFGGCEKLREVNLPEGFNAAIGTGAFVYCNSLKSLTIPDSLEALTDNPFIGKIIKLKISKKHPRLELVKDVLFDKVDKTLIMYPYAAKQKSYEVPKGTLKIGGGAFFGASLTKITLPEGLTHIRDEAFYGCSKLSNLKLPDGLAVIGSKAFYGCQNLNALSLPDSLTAIGREAFYRCENLKDLSLPANVGHIGMDAFTWWDSYQNHPVYIEISVPENSLTEKEWAGGSDLHLYLDYEAQARETLGYIPARERYPGVPELEVNAYLTRKGTFADLDKVVSNGGYWPSLEYPKSVYEKKWTDEAGEEYKLALPDFSSWIKWLEEDGWVCLGEYIPSPFDLTSYWAVPPEQDGDLPNTYFCSFLDNALLGSQLGSRLFTDVDEVYGRGLDVSEFESEPLLQESLIAQMKEGKIRLDYNYVGKPE